jgi:hypothetical protein
MLGNSLGEKAVRALGVAIARDRLGNASVKVRSDALAWIDTAFLIWQAAQAGPDGTVEKTIDMGLLLGGRIRERVATADARPEHCAGFDVKCPADLFVKLWAEDYDHVASISRKLGPDIALSLIIERDSTTMPIESVASAIHVLWNLQRATIDVLREALTGEWQKPLDRAAHMRATKKEKNTGALGSSERRSIAAGVYRAALAAGERKPKRIAVAGTVRQILVGRGQRKIPSVSTIDDEIKGVYDLVTLDFARIAKRGKAEF